MDVPALSGTSGFGDAHPVSKAPKALRNFKGVRVRLVVPVSPIFPTARKRIGVTEIDLPAELLGELGRGSKRPAAQEQPVARVRVGKLSMSRGRAGGFACRSEFEGLYPIRLRRAEAKNDRELPDIRTVRFFRPDRCVP
jgi:hypothetical protein